MDGNWYRLNDGPAGKRANEGWLCPALFQYFNSAPDRIYVKAEQLQST